MGKPSLVQQVKVALQAVFAPGTSRHALKTQQRSGAAISGIATMQTYLDDNCRFARWCHNQYGVRFLKEITPTIAEAYIQTLCDRELSGGYLGRVTAAIRKLDVGTRALGWRAKLSPPWLGENGGWHSDAHPERAYTTAQAQRLIETLNKARDPQIVNVVKLQYIAGLRIAEACMLRGQDIDVETDTLHLSRGTKGGRPRTVSVKAEHHAFLQELKDKAANHRDGHVFQGRGNRGQSLTQRVQAAVKWAAEREGIPHYSTHGFRRTYAQERYAESCASGQTDREARQAVSQDLGHNRVAVTYSYVSR